MKIQPIDSTNLELFETEKTVQKSRLRRLFDLSSFLRGSAVADRSGAGAGEQQFSELCSDEFEPSSVCLEKMVQSFIEDSNEKQSVPEEINCGRHHRYHCKCLTGNNYCSSDSSEDEFDSFNCFGNSNNNHDSSSDACGLLKNLVLCETVSERNLLADSAKIVDKNKVCKRKNVISRKIIMNGLLSAGYNVSICISRWGKTQTYPAGEYEYIDAMIEGDRLIIDMDFRSEFEIVRSTKNYKSILQILPNIFVGKADRLLKIINIVSDAAKVSMKKTGMPLPPWRKADYVKAKWFSPCTRINITESEHKFNTKSDAKTILTEEEGSPEDVKQWQPLEIKLKVSKTGEKYKNIHEEDQNIKIYMKKIRW